MVSWPLLRELTTPTPVGVREEDRTPLGSADKGNRALGVDRILLVIPRTRGRSEEWTAPASVDSGWLGGLLLFLFHFLVVGRRQVVERGVEPERVVEGFDVVEDRSACLGAVRRATAQQILGQ